MATGAAHLRGDHCSSHRRDGDLCRDMQGGTPRILRHVVSAHFL